MEEALKFYRYHIYRYQILTHPECQLSIVLTLQECIYVTVVLVFQTRTGSILTYLLVIREVDILILYPNIAVSFLLYLPYELHSAPNIKIQKIPFVFLFLFEA